jgi:hypothetical protein
MTNNVYAPPSTNVEGVSQGSLVERDVVAFDNLASADRWRFVWGFFWRSVCAAVLSALGGAVAGGVIGFITVVLAQVAGKSLADVTLLIRILGGLAGALVGFGVLWLLIRWCFRANWFGYRLRLVRDVA